METKTLQIELNKIIKDVSGHKNMKKEFFSG